MREVTDVVVLTLMQALSWRVLIQMSCRKMLLGYAKWKSVVYSDYISGVDVVSACGPSHYSDEE